MAESPHHVLILGSQNAKPKDQHISRSEIRPVQLLRKSGELEPIDFFNDWGALGVSSIAWRNPEPQNLWVSVNSEIYRLHLESASWENLNISHLDDIHDLHVFDATLWIANTGQDEVIAYDIERESVERRISLEPYRDEGNQPANDNSNFDDIKDRFHCNEVFLNYENEKCILVHHVSGWQFLRVLYEKLVKSQGNGGIINLDRDKIRRLNLQSPHTVRKINNTYWIQDSGDFSTKIYNQSWEQIDQIDIGGYGRGMAVDESSNTGYIGVSTTRKRYLKYFPGHKRLPNRIHTVDLENKNITATRTIPNIEQIDNVYLANNYLLDRLHHL